MCDLIVHTCVEPCYPDGSCLQGNVCRPSAFGVDVCLPALEASGVCDVATGAGRAAPWLLLVGLAIVLTLRWNVAKR